MDSRRLLLILGISLLVAAIAASFVPVPEEAVRDREGQAEPEPEPPPPPAGGELVEVSFSAGEARGSEEPPRTEVGLNRHVVVTVRAPVPGEVELEGLGLLEPVSPGVPAVFDLFTDAAGEYPVVYTPVEETERRVATLVVERRR